MNIYVASSWRNEFQPTVVQFLRGIGHEVYDFKNPEAGDVGFHWSQIDPSWEHWNVDEFNEALQHPLAVDGFACDTEAMEWADACVCVLPCGRSAHLEAGWFTGRDRPVWFYIPEEGEVQVEPELMYKIGADVIGTMHDLRVALDAYKQNQ